MDAAPVRSILVLWTTDVVSALVPGMCIFNRQMVEICFFVFSVCRLVEHICRWPRQAASPHLEADPTWPRDSEPGQEVTRRRGRAGAYVRRQIWEKKRSHADRKDAKPFRTLVPEDEGRVEGLKSSRTGEKKGGRGSHAKI